MSNLKISLPVVKRNLPEGLVTGWVAIVSDDQGHPIVDQQNEVIPIEVIEKAAQSAFPYAKSGAGDMHERRGLADIVESFVVSAEKREALGFGKGPEGWVVTLKIHDPKLRKEIGDGEKQELSMFGSARYTTTAKGVRVADEIQLDRMELLSVVDQGASGNDEYRPRIVLMKRATARTETGTIRSVLARIFRKQAAEDQSMTLEEILAELPEEKREVVLAALEAAKGAGETAEKAKGGEDGKPKPEPTADELAKRTDLPEAVRKRLAESEALAKRVASLEEVEVDRGFVAKAKGLAYLPGLPTEKLAKVLKSASRGMTADEFTDLEKSLASAAEAVKKSGLLKEIGTSRDEPTESEAAVAEMDAEVKKVRDKSPDITREQAIVRIQKRSPDMYERFSKAHRAEAV